MPGASEYSRADCHFSRGVISHLCIIPRGYRAMSEADLKVNAKVRKILIENNLDLSRLGISTTSGTVNIRGELKRLTEPEASDRDAAKLLILLEGVILRTKGVKRVSFNIAKWERKKGKWTKIKK